jgi:hypothetical protein
MAAATPELGPAMPVATTAAANDGKLLTWNRPKC